MRKYRKIIAAVDFSEHTEAVIHQALRLARQNSASVAVLHVVDHAWPVDADYVIPAVDEAEAKLVDAAHRRLDALLESNNEQPIERIVEVGRPKLEILRIAEREKADLLIMGTHGHHGISGLLGSTTDRIVHRAGCDVLVVRA